MLPLKYSVHYLILALIVAATVAIGLTPHALWGHWRFESFQLHSAVEGTGALVAVLMAVLILQREEEDAWRLHLAGIGLLGMGLLDLFHSTVAPGHGFVLLRSAAHLVGGVWFALVCVSWRPLRDAAGTKWLAWTVAAGCVLLGIWTLAARETLPVMVEDGQFAGTAVALNVTGGVLFLAAAVRFVADFHRSGRMEFYLFACIALLLGLGGVLFKYSTLWDDVWWDWHGLRLAAYFIALGIIYREYAISTGELTRHVAERTAALTKITEQLRQKITERKQMEDALRQNEERFRTLTIATTQMVWTTNAQGEVTEDIPTWRAFTGQSKGDITGGGWMNALHPDDAKRTSGVWQQAVNTRTLYQTEYRIRRHDGEYRDFSVCGVPVLEKDGGIREWIGTCTDITERKRTEEQLQAASLYSRSLIETSLDPLVTISPDGKITDVNDATIKVTGVPREGLIGTDFFTYFTEPEKARAGYREVFEKGFVTDYPLTIRRKDGRLTDVLYNASVYKDIAGKVLGVFAAARDVTESKRVMGEFAETKNFLDNILQSSTKYSIIGKDLDHLVLSWNEGAKRNYGYAAEEILGKDSNILHTPEDIKSGAVTKLLATAHEKGLAEGEFERVRKDGSRFMASVVVTRRNEASGRPIGYLLVSNDISEKKQAEEQLRYASQYARSLIEASLDPLVTISAEGKITDVNEATINVTGVARDKLIATDFSNYFTEPEKARAGYREVFEKGLVTDYPLTIRHRDGKLTDVLYNASVYKDIAGKVLGVFAAARDITEHKRAEEQLRATSLYTRSLIEASLDPLVTISADGTITDVNEATARVTGVARDQLIGSDFAEYFSEPEKARAGYQEVYARGFVIDYPLALRHVAGRVTDVLYNATLYKDETGNVTGVFAAARDITERKRAEEAIKTLNETLIRYSQQLETAIKDLEGFSYSVSHDLRAPLRAVDSFAKILVEDYAEKLDDEGRRLLAVVRDNAANMGKLIDDILAFSRAGRRDFALSEIDMEALTRMVFDEQKPTAGGRTVNLRISPLPPARADQAMIRQVLFNLFSNAIKFTRPRDIAVIEVSGRAAGGEQVYRVKDNGAGFDPQYAHKLFGVFQRLHGAEEFEGTGIGLAIVKRIIDKHGGRVWAESKLGEGAAFYFSLPRNTPDATNGGSL